MFVLTRSEQRLVIFVMIAIVLGTWIKHHHDMNLGVPVIQSGEPLPAPLNSPKPNDN